MFSLKRISPQAIPAALAKAERYRLLNQPRMAESICLDVLAMEPRQEEALVTLLLCLTDQFSRPGYGIGLKEARDILPRLPEGYARDYYDGVIHERWGKSLLSAHASGAGGGGLDPTCHGPVRTRGRSQPARQR